jgi:HEAT repeat protein
MKPLAARFFALTVAVVFLPSGETLGASGDGPKVDTVALARALEHVNDDVRRQAAEALVKCGAKAVPDLMEVLDHKKQGVRLLVMDVLGKIGPAAEMAVPLLGRVLEEGNDEDSSAAGSALAKIVPAAVPVLRELVGHKVERTRNRALVALASITGEPEKVVPVLAELLENKDVVIRRHAATALFRMTTEPIAPVLRALQDEDAEVRAHARGAMANSKHRGSSEWTKGLEKLLQHTNPGVRGDVLQVLAHVHHRDPSMKYGLQCLKDADAGVRGFAIQILHTATYPIEGNPYSVGQIAAQIAPVLTDPSKEVRKTAFAMMKTSGAEGVPHLAKLLDAQDSGIRKLAAETLFYNGAKKADLVEARLLELAERDPDPGIRAVAVLSYSRLGPKSIAALAALLRKEREDTVRVAALYALSLHQEEAAFLVPEFIAALKEDNPEVRRAAAFTFYFMRESGKQAIPALTAALADKDAETRAKAIWSLTMLTPESEPGIIEGIKSEDARVQEMALHTFWQRGFKNKTALPWLIKALKREEHQNVRNHAVYCLANLGADAKAAIPALEAITDPTMQVHIRFGLERIRGMDKK